MTINEFNVFTDLTDIPRNCEEQYSFFVIYNHCYILLLGLVKNLQELQAPNKTTNSKLQNIYFDLPTFIGTFLLTQWCLPRIPKWRKMGKMGKIPRWNLVQRWNLGWMKKLRKTFVNTSVSRFVISIARVFPKQYRCVIEMRFLDMFMLKPNRRHGVGGKKNIPFGVCVCVCFPSMK